MRMGWRVTLCKGRHEPIRIAQMDGRSGCRVERRQGHSKWRGCMAWKRYACAPGFGRLAVITAIAAVVVIAVIVIVVIVYLASLGLPACIPCLFGFASSSVIWHVMDT